MRTSKTIVLLPIAVLAMGAVMLPRESVSNDKRPAAAAVPPPQQSDGVEKGAQAYKRGDYRAAIRALEQPAADRVFLAQFLLAQIYADNTGTETDHAKAYMLYQSIADEYSDVDPDDMRRAPYVAHALTALAGYLLTGIPQIGVEPDQERAADYLHHAALFFGHEAAQFELVKLKLKGDGLPADVATAKHWLSVLTQRGHAGAQAFFADLYWRGKHVDRDAVRAMALIAVAVENAPPKDRIWIDDIYQNIYCGAAEGVRKQATGLVAEWRTRYGRKPDLSPRAGLAPLDASADRSCQNGETVNPLTTAKPQQGPPLPVPPAMIDAQALVPANEMTAGQPPAGQVPAKLPAPIAAAPIAPAPLAQGFAPDGLRDVGVTR